MAYTTGQTFFTSNLPVIGGTTVTSMAPVFECKVHGAWHKYRCEGLVPVGKENAGQFVVVLVCECGSVLRNREGEEKRDGEQ